MTEVEKSAGANRSLDPIVPIDFTPNQETTKRFSYRFRWFHAVVLVFSVLSSAAGFFVLTARSVFIEVNPASADIEISGGIALQLGPRYLLRSGTYRLMLKNEGYYDTSTQLIVGNEQSQTHPFDMRKLPGLVSIDTENVTGARVRIDGVDVGLTPLTDLSVEPGDHQLTISSDRYLDYGLPVAIEGRSVRQQFSARLEPAWATLSFTTVPAGADVIIDGALRGQTPLNAEILQGLREITLKLSGHKAWQEGYEITAGEDMVLPTIALEPADGLVFIRSDPTAASVTIGGTFQGQTPLEVALAPAEDHQITFFKDGYESSTTTVRTEPDQESEVTVSLSPVLASVSIIADPPDAELYVNGELMGPANQRLELMAVNQQIEIRKEGYVPYNTAFTSRPGLEQAIRVTLKSLEQARLEQIKPEISTVAGQSLKLFYPGSFTMGASRREAGRRPNENLREVKLERPFYLSYQEVTNSEFRRYDSEHSSGTIQGLTLDNEAQPAVQISWTQAALYCNWLSEQEGLPLFYRTEGEEVVGFNPDATGYRLPTEAEWAWVARTDGSGNVLKYPWGEQLPPPENAGNFADITARAYLGEVMFDYDDGYFATAPVASFQANQYGIFDMAGNVSEWVHDYYGAVGSVGGPEIDPKGPELGQFHTIRGSSWAHGAITEMRLSFRDFGEEPRDDVGFRIARYLED